MNELTVVFISTVLSLSLLTVTGIKMIIYCKNNSTFQNYFLLNYNSLLLKLNTIKGKTFKGQKTAYEAVHRCDKSKDDSQK